jgi:hypothetical protein
MAGILRGTAIIVAETVGIHWPQASASPKAAECDQWSRL